MERLTTKSNIIYVTVEDKEDKILRVAKTISTISKVKLISKISDESFKYELFINTKNDIRKEISSKFAMNDILILEMQKKENSLEDAFLDIVNHEENEKQKGGK